MVVIVVTIVLTGLAWAQPSSARPAKRYDMAVEDAIELLIKVTHSRQSDIRDRRRTRKRATAGGLLCF